MLTLAVGMWQTSRGFDMPTASVGMAPDRLIGSYRARFSRRSQVAFLPVLSAIGVRW